MNKHLLLLTLILQGVCMAQSQQKGDLDTMVFDLSNASIYSGTGGITYFEFPVYAVTTGGISNFDFWFKFNESKLTYDLTTAVDTKLDSYSNYNAPNKELSNTTSGPSLSYIIKGNTPLVKLRFRLATPNTKIIKTDFFESNALFNGSPANFKWTLPSAVSAVGLAEYQHETDCLNDLQNPVKDDVLLQIQPSSYIELLTMNGEPIWHETVIGETLHMPLSTLVAGVYLLRLNAPGQSCMRRLIVLN